MSVPHKTDAKKERNKTIVIDYSRVHVIKGKHVFEYYESKLRKTIIFCTEIQQSVDIYGNYFYSRCSYNAEDNHFMFNHICSFEILLPVDFQPPEYFTKKSAFVDKKISDLVGKLVIETGLSFRMSASSPFKDFITKLLKTGYNIGAKKLIDSSDEIQQVKYSVESVKRYVEAESKRVKTENELAIAKLDFYAIALDAGTIDSRKSLYMCIANPSLLPKHIYIGNVNMDHEWCAKDYKNWGVTMMEAHPKLSAFVGDGLPAGTSGLAHYNANSATSDNCAMVIFVQCNNHILNKSFEKACASNDDLKAAIENLDAITTLLRKPFVKQKLKGNVKVPKFPKTRWLYAFDALLWIFQREESINKALWQAYSEKAEEYEKITKQRKIPEEFSHLIDALMPIKKLQLAFENEKTALPLVYPFLVRTIRIYQSMINGNCNPGIIKFARPIMNSLISEFKDKARIPLLVFSFAITPLGANYINGASWDRLFNTTLLSILNESKPIAPNSSELEEEEENIENDPEEIVPVHYVQHIIRSDINGNIQIDKEHYDELNKDIRLPDDLIFTPENVLVMAVDFFENREFLRQYKCRKPCNNEMRKQINDHVGRLKIRLMSILRMNPEVDNINMFKFEDSDMYGYGFYKMHMMSKNQYALIAMHAMQMMSIPAGESSCERAISRARCLIGSHRSRESNELRNARLFASINAQISHGNK